MVQFSSLLIGVYAYLLSEKDEYIEGFEHELNVTNDENGTTINETQLACWSIFSLFIYIMREISDVARCVFFRNKLKRFHLIHLLDFPLFLQINFSQGSILCDLFMLNRRQWSESCWVSVSK